jgi:hypothetical protein
MACSASRSGGFRLPSGQRSWRRCGPVVVLGIWGVYMLAHANDAKPAAWVPAPISTGPNAPRWQPVCTVNGRAIEQSRCKQTALTVPPLVTQVWCVTASRRRRVVRRSRDHFVATIVKSMPSESLTATTPPTETGLMPNADCLISKWPFADSLLSASSTRTGTVTGCVTSRIVS